MIRVLDTRKSIPPECPLAKAFNLGQCLTQGFGVLYILMVTATELDTAMTHQILGCLVSLVVQQRMTLDELRGQEGAFDEGTGMIIKFILSSLKSHPVLASSLTRAD